MASPLFDLLVGRHGRLPETVLDGRK